MIEIFDELGWWAFIDICIIAVVIYYALLLIKGTRTAQMLTGILFIVVCFYASSILPLTTLNWFMGKLYSSIVLILIILFQDDIRHGLRRLGKKPFVSTGEKLLASQKMIDDLTRAAFQLAQKKLGALIVIERNIILSRYIQIGTVLDAVVSPELLGAIFHTSSPIHDGAVILQQGRISAAGCFLPLTKDDFVNTDMGTRHRAAIGVSQETDAFVILVSEEKKTVSLVYDGKVHAIPQQKEELRRHLKQHLVEKK